jgi:hypothetical protein
MATLQLVVSGEVRTVVEPVGTPVCEVPDPIADSAAFGASFVALLAAVWGGRALYRMFTKEVIG